MTSAASQHRTNKKKLANRLLIDIFIFCIFNKPVLCWANDEQELATIKAQMHKLAAQIEAIEQRQAHKQGLSRSMHTDHSRAWRVGSTKTLTASKGQFIAHPHGISEGPADTSIWFSPDTDSPRTVAGLPFKSTPSGNGPLGFQWMPEADDPQITHSNIDLSSSSPEAITQTAVDTLPPIFRIGGISVRLGGFFELSNIWRSSNMSSGPSTAWGKLPYANSPNHGLDEERLSAQLSRMSVLMESNPSKSVRLQAYVESDFGGAAGTSNSVESSGYTPRLRQGYFTFTEKDWGFHILMGQAWSLATNYAKGILPRHEQLPPVTDTIPGIIYTRVPQIRIGKDWNQKYWLGFSIEDPQATVGFSSSFASGDTLPAAYGQVHGVRVYYSNPGGTLLNSSTQYTDNPVPDIIVKGAVDTSFGHYEVFGLARWFRSLAVAPGASTTKKHTTFGGGIGAGMTIPLVTKKLQLAGNVIAGDGIGRYGPTQLPDTTFNGRGHLSPIPEMMGALGLIGHPTSSVLLYTYGGVETAGRKRYMGADGHQHGYGATDMDLGGCDIEFGNCNAQTRTLASLTAGGWWHFMQGQYGSVMAGLQYTYIRKFAFRGNNSAGNSVYPTTEGNIVYVTFRYFPFQ